MQRDQAATVLGYHLFTPTGAAIEQAECYEARHDASSIGSGASGWSRHRIHDIYS